MRRIFPLLLVGITLFGLILRLDGVDAQSLWLDESICWRDVHASWPDFIDTLLAGECMPPLFFAVLKLWTGLVGESVLALRLPSVVFGTLTISLLGWFVARLTGPGAGCLAALLLAVSPLHVRYSQEARPYAFYALVVLASTAALAWALETGRAASWAKGSKWPRSPVALFACYGLLALLALFSDNSYALSAFGRLTATAVMFWALQKWKGKRPGQLESYAFFGILAYYLRDYYYPSPFLVLAATAAVFWALETALERREGGQRAWRFGAYVFLAFLAFASQYVNVNLPFCVLGATAAAYWALEIQSGGKREGGEEIYAILVLISFYVYLHDAVVPFLILAAAVPTCWALEKWKLSQSTKVNDRSHGVTRAAVDSLPPAPSPSPAPFLLVRFSIYAFLALLACYTHYFSAFFMAGHGAFVAFVCWKERRVQPARNWILCMVAVGVCYLAWLPFMLQFDLVGTNWVRYFLRNWSPLKQLWITLKTLVFGYTYPMWHGDAFPDAVLALSPLAIWLGYRRSQESALESQRPGNGNHLVRADSSPTSESSPLAVDSRPVMPDAFAYMLFGVMTVVPLLAAWTFSQYRPSLVDRYVIPIVPAVLALLALAIWRVRWLVPRVVLAAALTANMFGNLELQQANPFRPALDLAAAHVAAHMQPGDGIVVEPAECYLVLKYYLREDMPPLVYQSDLSLGDPDAYSLPDDMPGRLAPFQRVWLVRIRTEDAEPAYPIERYLDAHYAQAAAPLKLHRIPALKLYELRQR